MKENGPALPNKGDEWSDFAEVLVAALLWVRDSSGTHGGGVDNHFPTVRNRGKWLA